ncbi:CHAT domain-containing protein [Streptomyces sp. WMMC500]|uniref:CHAT domain-containing protein n=1 Tax=Streptomyces sp. WMMC500 TaxID=3015154 RepID=UPI00248B08E1|nr:CHAT domain-containing protein [Streptomyces sp. WMMC500]WBB64541.1 CHAT domain-containing protein [Streptomyces sp. WMMC500]
MHPAPADRYVELSTALDRPPGPGFSSAHRLLTDRAATATDPLQSEDRYALAEDLDALLAEIRGRPGFADFLRPPQVEDLLSAGSAERPVVVVNASRLGCHALLLNGEAPRPLPLPLEYADLLRRVRDFHAAVRTAGDGAASLTEQQDAQGTARATLEWLWEALARPVLDALDLAAPSARQDPGPLPRLWWVPTGPLTALPLHAAGPGGATARDGVLDRVVSSYAPTVRSLIHARRHAGSRDPGQPGARPRPLVVAMPETPGAADLPGVAEETAVLTARFPGSRVLTGPRAIRPAVLAALPRHGWAHFACHAVGAADAVSAGHLLLHDHGTAALTVTDVARLRLRDARLAYLSACETHLGPRALADEALHVVGAFHMAGFTHVIGTLWRVDDHISATVAGHFYDTVDGASPVPRDDEPARALHAAVRTQRGRYPLTPTLWAAYLHVGA